MILPYYSRNNYRIPSVDSSSDNPADPQHDARLIAMRSIPLRLWALAFLSAILQILPFPIAGPVPLWRRAILLVLPCPPRICSCWVPTAPESRCEFIRLPFLAMSAVSSGMGEIVTGSTARCISMEIFRRFLPSEFLFFFLYIWDSILPSSERSSPHCTQSILVTLSCLPFRSYGLPSS